MRWVVVVVAAGLALACSSPRRAAGGLREVTVGAPRGADDSTPYGGTAPVPAVPSGCPADHPIYCHDAWCCAAGLACGAGPTPSCEVAPAPMTCAAGPVCAVSSGGVGQAHFCCPAGASCGADCLPTGTCSAACDVAPLGTGTCAAGQTTCPNGSCCAAGTRCLSSGPNQYVCEASYDNATCPADHPRDMFDGWCCPADASADDASLHLCSYPPRATGAVACGSGACAAGDTCNGTTCQTAAIALAIAGACGATDASCTGGGCCAAPSGCWAKGCDVATTAAACPGGEVACHGSCCAAGETCGKSGCEVPTQAVDCAIPCGADCCPAGTTCSPDTTRCVDAAPPAPAPPAPTGPETTGGDWCPLAAEIPAGPDDCCGSTTPLCGTDCCPPGDCAPSGCACPGGAPRCGTECCGPDQACSTDVCITACPADLPTDCGTACCNAGNACDGDACACPVDHPVACGFNCCLDGGPCNGTECACPDGELACGDYCCDPGQTCDADGCHDPMSCGSGYEVSLRFCSGDALSNTCSCNGDPTDTCVGPDYFAAIGVPDPGACTPEHGSCWNAGLLDQPCCPGFVCAVGAQCAGAGGGECVKYP